jgi:hypothetical protein
MTNSQLQLFQYGTSPVRTVMANGEPWVVARDPAALTRGSPTPWHGYVYALDYGGKVKIGHTTDIKTRMLSLTHAAKHYGGIPAGAFACSRAHTNHQENEALLHKHFAQVRMARSELFAISLEEFLGQLPALEFKDDSLEQQRRADAFLESMKGFILRGEALRK